MSTVIDYDRTYLVGRGVLKFGDARLKVGEALSPEQLRSIARPEGFLSTGRIYPAPVGWSPPVDSPVDDGGLHAPAAVSPIAAEGLPEVTSPASDAMISLDPAALSPQEQEAVAAAFVEAPESVVAAPEPALAPEVDMNDPAAVALAQARAEADLGDDSEFEEEIPD